MPGVIAQIPKFQFSANGVPMVGGSITAFIAGTTTPTTTWQDYALSIANTNPVVLDSRGECMLWLDPSIVYKFILKNAQGVVQWTQDNITNPAALTNALRAELISSSGASLVGGGDQVVASITALRSLLKTSASKNALVTGYYAAGDGGGGAYYYDSTDITTSDNGGTVIVASDAGRWKLAHGGVVSVKQFGAKGDGFTNDTAAITAFRNYLYAQSVLPDAVWQAGTYIYSVSPNWNIPRLKMRSLGVVRLRYTGTGDAFIIADADMVGLYDQEIGHFTIEAPSTALNGVHITSTHHSKYDFNVRGCGLTSAGVLVNFSVCNEYRLTVSNNENGIIQGWYKGLNGIEAKPMYGLFLDQRNSGEAATANTFINPILEGTQYGAWLQSATGNAFFSGTMEGCSNKGINLQPGAVSNVLYNVDFEVNTNHDIYCLGNFNEFHQCQTMTLVSFDGTANGNHLAGGIHQLVALTAATVRNSVRDLIYNRFAVGGVLSITDTSGRQNFMTSLTNALNGLNTNGDEAAFAVTVTTSPYTYTNSTKQPLLAAWGGGTVSSGSLKRGAAQLTAGGAMGNVILRTGDQLVLVHTATPSLTIYPQ